MCQPLLQPGAQLGALLQMQSTHTGRGNRSCSRCFARRCWRSLSLPRRCQTCVLIPPCPQDHPAELSFDAQPMGRLWRYLCTSAAPGRPSAAAGRCSGLSGCSIWTPFSGSEALKTKRGRVDTLPHFSPTGSACLQPLQAWPQCFPEVWSCKVPLWEQGRLPSSAPGFALQSAWPSLPLI